MILYPLNPPATPGFQSMSLTLDDAVALCVSPFTFATQVQVHQGQRWIIDAVTAPMHGDQSAAWEAWFAGLRGQYGIFNIGDSARKTPRGTAAGTPVVSGAGQTGMTLVTSGWGVSQIVLRAGDYIQLGAVNEFTSEFTEEFGSDSIARLHKVLANVTSDASGNATLDIWPRLRSSPTSGATVVTTNCKGTFRLAENARSWTSDSAKIRQFSFRAIEAF